MKSIAHKFNIQFNRNELAGAFGDLGTDFPLLIGVILAAKLDASSVLIIFGIMQLSTALVYQMPMPVQPLKAMAAIVISQKIQGEILFGAGLAIGVLMLIISLFGGLEVLSRLVPKPVIRGIQFGLGLQLALLALKDYIPSDGMGGYLLAFAAFVITILFIQSKRYPPALCVIALGLLYALFFKVEATQVLNGFGFSLPDFFVPSWEQVVTGFFLLALPQLPLSLGNSILATKQLSSDLFPEKSMTIKKIGLTYSLMNLLSPFLSGVPVCHGSGGMAGHYAFGGRTGGSVAIYGLIYIVIGLFFASSLESIAMLFPLPVLGVLLFFEGATLMQIISDSTSEFNSFFVVIVTGLVSIGMPYGYLIALIFGSLLWHFKTRK